MHVLDCQQTQPHQCVQAQSRRNLCVWYSIHKAEQPFIFEIEGTVQDIERNSLATEVLVQEDPNGGEDGIVGYQLDDNLVRIRSSHLHNSIITGLRGVLTQGMSAGLRVSYLEWDALRVCVTGLQHAPLAYQIGVA